MCKNPCTFILPQITERNSVNIMSVFQPYLFDIGTTSSDPFGYRKNVQTIDDTATKFYLRLPGLKPSLEALGYNFHSFN